MRLCSLSTYRKKSSFREGAGLTFNKIIYVGKNLKKSKLYQKNTFFGLIEIDPASCMHFIITIPR